MEIFYVNMEIVYLLLWLAQNASQKWTFTDDNFAQIAEIIALHLKYET